MNEDLESLAPTSICRLDWSFARCISKGSVWLDKWVVIFLDAQFKYFYCGSCKPHCLKYSHLENCRIMHARCRGGLQVWLMLGDKIWCHNKSPLIFWRGSFYRWALYLGGTQLVYAHNFLTFSTLHVNGKITSLFFCIFTTFKIFNEA